MKNSKESFILGNLSWSFSLAYTCFKKITQCFTLNFAKCCRKPRDDCYREPVFSDNHYVKVFPAFGLNMEIYCVNLRIQSKCGKIRTRRTTNTNTFYAVNILSVNFVYFEGLIIESHQVTVSSCWPFSASWVIFFIIDFYHGLKWCRKILPMSVNTLNDAERLSHTLKGCTKQWGCWRHFKPKSSEFQAQYQSKC